MSHSLTFLAHAHTLDTKIIVARDNPTQLKPKQNLSQTINLLFKKFRHLANKYKTKHVFGAN